jgi:hypothetical protein
MIRWPGCGMRAARADSLRIVAASRPNSFALSTARCAASRSNACAARSMRAVSALSTSACSACIAAPSLRCVRSERRDARVIDSRARASCPSPMRRAASLPSISITRSMVGDRRKWAGSACHAASRLS